ncbi:MAG: hypothetical protein WCY16_01420 [Weeksellaceae bacterium]
MEFINEYETVFNNFLLNLWNILSGASRKSTTTEMELKSYSEKNLSILTGVNFQNYWYGELGIAVNKFGQNGHHPFSVAYFISSEMKFDENFILGPKIGVWAGGGSTGILGIGLNLIYYTDFDESSLRFRPEAGLAFGKVKIFYGYNVALTNKNFEGINKNNFGVTYLFGVKKLKQER